SSPAMTAVHPASLISPELHAPTLLELVHMRMTPLHTYLISHTVLGIIDLAFHRVYSPAVHSRLEGSRAFIQFVDHVVAIAQVPVPTLLVALVYLHRVKLHIPPLDRSTNERIFLGALIIAHKYANDCAIKAKYWAALTEVFDSRDISSIERDFLLLLDYRLSISESDLLDFYPFLVGSLPAP
ncbi:hypothetical protein L227DRAFT_463902, partial [Lentinus tigrinus ALCF2SS1-6]